MLKGDPKRTILDPESCERGQKGRRLEINVIAKFVLGKKLPEEKERVKRFVGKRRESEAVYTLSKCGKITSGREEKNEQKKRGTRSIHTTPSMYDYFMLTCSLSQVTPQCLYHSYKALAPGYLLCPPIPGPWPSILAACGGDPPPPGAPLPRPFMPGPPRPLPRPRPGILPGIAKSGFAALASRMTSSCLIGRRAGWPL